jgi:imidazolonepropionase-like amidohydrolase
VFTARSHLRDRHPTRYLALSHRHRARPVLGRSVAQLAKLVKWYTPFEVLKMATSGNASLLEMCGPRNPYPKKLGVIEEGAYADLILVDGDPLANISLVANPEKNFVLIIKNGEVIKNTIK